MSSPYRQLFRFKKFDIYQDDAEMKVGTDAVLLGAWSFKKNPKNILDVGTGNGIIALMLAQRFPNTQIDAVEIDTKAALQAQHNFQISKWNKRIKIYNENFLSFKPQTSYDFIISNPPFFDEQVLSGNLSRDTARHTLQLNLEQLVKKSIEISTQNFTLQLILPIDKLSHLEEIIRKHSLYINKLMYIKGRESATIKRLLVALSFQKTFLSVQTMIIEKKRHIYTDDYINLTKDFYLKM